MLTQTYLKEICRNTLGIVYCLSCFACQKSSNLIDDDLIGPKITQPIWHPNGVTVGYNKVISTTIFPSFGMVNIDGSNQVSLTDSTLYNPSWSPDGKWLAYSNGNDLFTMSFKNYNLDTNNRQQLTINQPNAYQLTWSMDSKSIYFTSKTQIAGSGGLYKFTLADNHLDTIENCNSVIGFINDPFYFGENSILLSRIKNGSLEFVVLDTLGQLEKEIQMPDQSLYRITQPQFYNDRIYFGFNGIWSMKMDGTDWQKVNDYSYYGFSVSRQGYIAYTHIRQFVDYPNINAADSLGELWIMKVDGSENHRVTKLKFE